MAREYPFVSVRQCSIIEIGLEMLIPLSSLLVGYSINNIRVNPELIAESFSAAVPDFQEFPSSNPKIGSSVYGWAPANGMWMSRK